jgi:hypothetical protein
MLVMQIALHPSDVGGYEDPEWAWWLGEAFVHDVGIGSVIFVVSVCGAPGFLAERWWVVVRNAECL